MFFPDALSQFIYQNVPPYTDHGHDRDVLNANDNIASQATRASFAYVKELEERYLVAMIVGVDPTAESSTGFGGAPGGGAGGEPPSGPPPGGAPTDGAMSAPSTETSVSLVPGIAGIR